MTTHHLLMLLPMLALLAWAAVQDLRTRKIRNWLTLSLAWGGLLSSLFLPVLVTPRGSIFGLLVGFALPFVLFAVGALGGGDVKLLAGVGAWLGPMNVMWVFLLAAIVGLLIVLAQALAQRRCAALFRNSTVLLLNIWHVGDLGTAGVAETGKACRSVDRPLPYAVPVLAATLLVVTVW
jgi:prepilin peptidase CpaA